MHVLLNSSGSFHMISKKSLPCGVKVDLWGPRYLINTLAGNMQSTGKAPVQGIWLPEFDKSLVIDNDNFLLFNAKYKYDIILQSISCPSTESI